MSEKVVLTPKQAEELDAMLASYTVDEILNGIVNNRHVVAPKELRDVRVADVIKALFRGYEVEKTPEEKVRDYYEKNTDTYRFERWHAESAGNAIKETLNILGIKIEGVNA